METTWYMVPDASIRSVTTGKEIQLNSTHYNDKHNPIPKRYILRNRKFAFLSEKLLYPTLYYRYSSMYLYRQDNNVFEFFSNKFLGTMCAFNSNSNGGCKITYNNYTAIAPLGYWQDSSPVFHSAETSSERFRKMVDEYMPFREKAGKLFWEDLASAINHAKKADEEYWKNHPREKQYTESADDWLNSAIKK